VLGRGATFVVYRGPSLINGAPIVAILTGADGSSANAKTGPMGQLWIMHADIPPHDAQRTGDDAAVCGDCPLRPSANGSARCYVKTFQGPLSTWKHNRDRAVDLQSAVETLRRSGVALRLGAYGEPAALPENVIATLARAARNRVTAYTHQWRRAPWLKAYAMASVETRADAMSAKRAGWRYFRVLAKGVAPARDEMLCPYEGRGLQCNACGVCNGAASRAKSVAIHAH
jgi:hypothetical protein